MYKLNPDLPLVWRTPTTLQCGVDTGCCVISDLTPAQERFIVLLQKGFSEPSLPLIARECGLSLSSARSLLVKLEPALNATVQPRSLRIALDGQGVFVDQLGTLLVQCGHRVVIAGAVNAGPTDLAILVGTFALPPHRAGDWLRRGVPHLTICWGDGRVQISPLFGIVPEDTSDISRFPCAECLELHRRDADEFWPVIATQVADTPASSLTPLLRHEVASLIGRWINRPQLFDLSTDTGFHISASTGEKEKVTFSLHPECACQALPRNVSVLGSSRGRFPVAPTREKVVDVPA